MKTENVLYHREFIHGLHIFNLQIGVLYIKMHSFFQIPDAVLTHVRELYLSLITNKKLFQLSNERVGQLTHILKLYIHQPIMFLYQILFHILWDKLHGNKWQMPICLVFVNLQPYIIIWLERIFIYFLFLLLILILLNLNPTLINNFYWDFISWILSLPF